MSVPVIDHNPFVSGCGSMSRVRCCKPPASAWAYGAFDLFGLQLGGYGDLIALYGGLYGSLGFGGNTSFFVGAGGVLGIEVNPIPQVFGVYAEFGLGIGVPSIVDANLSVGVRIFVGKLF
jgi:hypothetical protein